MEWLDAIQGALGGEADILSTLGLILAVVFFGVQQLRANAIQKQDTYQKLELASNELFRFEAQYAEVLDRYMSIERASEGESDSRIASSFVFQTLNLFEMAVRLRQARVFQKEIFGSWVVWYYDLLKSWYFRQEWRDLRQNYTRELRSIFDEPVAAFDPEAADNSRRQQFFAHVAKVLDCPIIRRWVAE